jgi:SWI/SNF-related matrix-associated actin-dependent regulator of chromatin subfamily A-like protein 1
VRFIERANDYFIPVHRKGDVPWIGFLDDTKYLSTTKTWHIPKTPLNRAVLQKKGFVQVVGKKEITPLPKKLRDALPKNLYDVQVEALTFIYSYGGNGLISHKPGMGKTATSLLYTVLEEMETVVIVCQASLKTQWEAQIQLWLDEYDIHIINGQKPQRVKKKFMILNYEILAYHIDFLKSISPDLLIIDEVQFFKNHKAQRTKALYSLSFGCDRVIALSGSPIERRPVEFYPILHMLRADLFDTFFHYTNRYCDAHIGRYGWDYDGVSNVQELRDHLQTIMIRRTKSDSMDIPERVVIPLMFEMSNEKLYAKEEQKMIEVFGNGNYLENKKSIVYMQYLAYLGKRDSMLKWIEDFISDGTKLIIFAQHRNIVEDINEHFKDNSVKYYGGMSNVEKQEAKDKFINKVDLFVANMQSGGTGLDGLQHVCNNVCVVELGWTSTGFDQAIGRVERLGQKNEVNVYVPLTKGSIETHIMSIIDKSREITTQILDGVDVKPLDLLKELVKMY